MTDQVNRAEYEEHKDACGRSFDENTALLRNIDTRLFHDNGTKSFQTRLNEHGNFISGMVRIMWIVIGAVILVAVPAIIGIFWRLAVINATLGAQ